MQAADRPVFHEGRHTLYIDSCEPQIRAAAAGKIDLVALSHGNYPGEIIDAGTLPGLSSIGYMNIVGAQDWGIENHCNEGVEFCLLETGSMFFQTKRQRCRIAAGSLTMTAPWQAHKIGDPHIGPGRLHWVIIDVGVRHPQQQWRWPQWLVLSREDLGELTQLLRTNPQPAWKADADIEHCFRAVADAIRGPRQSRASCIAVHLNHLLLSVLQLLRRQPPGKDDQSNRSRSAVNQFLRNLKQDTRLLARPWTLADMADRCRLGTTAFVKHTRALLNQSPNDYLMQCRLERAVELLRENRQLRIADIAEACGFSSSQYFATCFRRRYGHPPSEH